MDATPYDIKYNIALQTDYETLEVLCQTSKEFNQICNSDKFWERKTWLDLSPDKDEYEVISHLYGDQEAYMYFKNIDKSPYKETRILYEMYTEILSNKEIIAKEEGSDVEEFEDEAAEALDDIETSLKNITDLRNFHQVYNYPLIVKIVLSSPDIIIYRKIKSLAESLLNISGTTVLFGYLLQYTLHQMRAIPDITKNIQYFLKRLLKIIEWSDLYRIAIVLNVPEINLLINRGRDLDRQHNFSQYSNRLPVSKLERSKNDQTVLM